MKITAVQCKYKLKPNTFARAIMYFQKTKFSHYAIQVETTGKLFYFDSTGAGVRKSASVDFLRRYELIGKFEVKQFISYIDFEKFFSKHEGKQYGYFQVIGLFFKGLNILCRNPFGKGAKRIICNELVILFLNHFGYTCIKDTDSLDLNDTTKLLEKVL